MKEEKIVIKTHAGERWIYRRKGSRSDKSVRSAISSKKPWESQSLAVPMSQAAEFQKNAPAGVQYEPRDNGFANPVCTSRTARNALLKQRGSFDRDAGYGDHSGS